MCAVSMIIDYGRDRIWPHQPWTTPNMEPVYPLPIPQFPQIDEAAMKAKLDAFLKLIEQAKETDKVTNQPDCEDPEKVKWLRELVRRFDGLEERVNRLFPSSEPEVEPAIC